MKPLQGNLDFFLIRASRGPFRLKHKTQGPSHIHIPKGKLRMRCLWKMAYLFIRNKFFKRIILYLYLNCFLNPISCYNRYEYVFGGTRNEAFTQCVLRTAETCWIQMYFCKFLKTLPGILSITISKKFLSFL